MDAAAELESAGHTARLIPPVNILAFGARPL